MSEKKYLKWYQKVAYGTGDVAGNCGYALISSFMMLYLTNSVGLNSAIIGTLMMVSKLLEMYSKKCWMATDIHMWGSLMVIFLQLPHHLE